MLPEYPHLRLSKAVAMKYFTIVSDDLVEMGPHSGQYKATFECLVVGCNGECGVPTPITHKDGRAVSTTCLRTALRCSKFCLASFSYAIMPNIPSRWTSVAVFRTDFIRFRQSLKL